MGYIRAKQESFDFEGAKVKATIRAIEYGDFVRVESTRESIKDAVETMSDVVKKYVTLDSPPLAQDGSTVTLDEICSQAYFLDLLTDMFYVVVKTGRVKDPLASAGSLPSTLAATGNPQTNGAPAKAA